MRKLLKGRWHDERGVTAIVVAICLFAVMAAAMLSLDAGNLWSNRRNVITGTDSSVLTAARSAVSTNNWTTCSASALTSLLANTPSAQVSKYQCNLNQVGTTGTGYAVVSVYRPSSVGFGKAVGVGDQSIYSLSAAEIGRPSNVQGLRPFGFCINNPHFQQWLALQRFLTGKTDPGSSPPTSGYYNGVQYTQSAYNALQGTGPQQNPNTKFDYDQVQYPNAYTPGHVIHRVSFDKNNTACTTPGGDSVPGNWGWIDFNGSSGNSINVDWILNGYPGSVGIQDCNADGTTGDPCGGTPGDKGGSVANALDTLVSSGQIFFVPLFDNATVCHSNCNGNNANFNMVGFVGVRLWGYNNAKCGSTTQECSNNLDNFFDMEFVNAITEGTCCTTSGPDTGARIAFICGVDHDPVALATRCTRGLS